MPRLLRALLIVSFTLLPVGVAYASPPAPASGTLAVVSASPPEIREADGNTIVSQTLTMALTGTFDGTFVVEVRFVIHPSGQVNDHGYATFTGAVDGQYGTLEMRTRGTPGPIDGFTIVNGTGGLAGLRGHGTVIFTSPATGTYSGQVHFDP